MKKFQYDSLAEKFLNIAGVPYSQSGATKTLMERAHLVVIDTDHNDQAARDWCETHFGNDWIYRWNQYYFKNHQDATLFALRWS